MGPLFLSRPCKEMSVSATANVQKVSGDTGTVIAGLSLTANNSLVLGYACAPIATGYSNSYMGYAAATNTTTGSYNSVYGFACCQNIAGDGNVYVGMDTARNVSFANANTFVGTVCGPTCTTGSSNTLLGQGADLGGPFDSGCVAVGAGAVAHGTGAAAIGAGTVATGDGSFNLVNRITGTFAPSVVPAVGTYTVRVAADVTRLDGALAFASGWQASLTPLKGSGFQDLVFQSANRAVVRFTDEFSPSIFDFTGQHRCAFLPPLHPHPHPEGEGEGEGEGPGWWVGRIVVATGAYRDLEGREMVHVDEAVPVVELCARAADPRVFGVISSFEPMGHGTREFRFGHLSFETACSDVGTRVVVNSVGEGAVLVCGAGGPIRNGDFITSSHVPGVGMRQLEVQLLNTTVAKATCDCAFAPIGHDSENEVRLIGCTYKC